MPKKFRPDKVRAVLDLSPDGKALLVYCRERDRDGMVAGKTAFSRWLLQLAQSRPVVLVTENDKEPIGAIASRVNLITK